MKSKYYIVAMILGFAIGLAQLFVVYDAKYTERVRMNDGLPVCLALTPECGVCDGEYEKDGYCYYSEVTEKRRGYPLYVTQYGNGFGPDISAALYVNVVIWMLGLPVLLLVANFTFKLLKRNKK